MTRLCGVLSLLAVTVAVAPPLVAVAVTQAAEREYQAIAGRIFQTYQSRWSELSPDKQKHWALRLYRVTGDTSWYPAIRFDLRQTIMSLKRDCDSLGDSAYYRRRVDASTEAMDWGKRKNDARRALFENRPEILPQLNILYNLATVDDYQPKDSSVNLVCSCARRLIQPEAIVDFLTDSATIISYGPQAANAVEYLHQLGLIDAGEKYRAAFRQAFPDSLDKKLDDLQFADKVYGLTHIVISASGYYQRKVEVRDVQWVLEYFRQRQNRILKRLSSDVIAEVGLCFLLCGDSTSEIIDNCRKAVVKNFDRNAGLIVSPSGSADLVAGEHRNVLAYMLLQWPPELSPGPRIPIDRLR